MHNLIIKPNCVSKLLLYVKSNPCCLLYYGIFFNNMLYIRMCLNQLKVFIIPLFLFKYLKASKNTLTQKLFLLESIFEEEFETKLLNLLPNYRFSFSYFKLRLTACQN